MSDGDLTVQSGRDLLQSQLVQELAAQSGHEGVVAGWVPPLHPHSELIRALEAEVFPEIPDIMRPYELACEFLALVDTRPSEARVVHAFRLSGATGLGPTQSPDGVESVLLEDLAASDQGVDLPAITDYYAGRGIDLRRSLSIETNFRVGARAEAENGLPAAQLGYVALFQQILRENVQVLFAHMNEPAMRSLANVGVGSEPIAGRDDLRTPTVGGSFDDDYAPIAILVNAENSAVLASLSDFAAPEVRLS
ncbi:MAG: hypothetical protein ACT4PI_14450 [Actinomycetota bacterium]